jgi:membrane protease YdiL (CAAX protease family)
LAIPVILLATHIVAGKPWKVHWREVAWMYAESLLCAVPLLVLNWTVPLSAAENGAPAFLAALAQGIGAGVYEELVFRLVFISLVLVIGADVLGGERRIVGGAAVALSALLFAAHHHYPIGAEPFSSMRFLFRAVAGLYLATIFWYRGYASAAGCHAAYNAVLVVLS